MLYDTYYTLDILSILSIVKFYHFSLGACAAFSSHKSGSYELGSVLV
jgi:hypothetical protein